MIDENTDGITLLPAGNFQAAMALDVLRNRLFVSDPVGNQIVILDGATNTTTSFSCSGEFATHLAFNPLTNEIYTTNVATTDATIYEAPPGKLPFALLAATE